MHINIRTHYDDPLKTGVNIGSYILISLETNPDGLYNLQTAKFIDLIDRNETGETTLSANRCSFMGMVSMAGHTYRIFLLKLTVPERISRTL